MVQSFYSRMLQSNGSRYSKERRIEQHYLVEVFKPSVVQNQAIRNGPRSSEMDDGRSILLVFLCMLSQGRGIFLLDTKKLWEHRSKAGGLIWLPLLRTVKGDKGTHTYLLRSVPQTDTGITVEAQRGRLLKVHEHFGR